MARKETRTATERSEKREVDATAAVVEGELEGELEGEHVEGLAEERAGEVVAVREAAGEGIAEEEGEVAAGRSRICRISQHQHFISLPFRDDSQLSRLNT